MSTKPRKWKYAKHASKRRYCEECRKRLRKEETILCKVCFKELIHGISNKPDEEVVE